MEDKPIRGLDLTIDPEGLASPIPRKKRSPPEPGVSNGHIANGTAITNGVAKRPAPDGEIEGRPNKRTASGSLDNISTSTKRTKTQSNGAPADNDLILVEDSGDGAIVIDDD